MVGDDEPAEFVQGEPAEVEAIVECPIGPAGAGEGDPRRRGLSEGTARQRDAVGEVGLGDRIGPRQWRVPGKVLSANASPWRPLRASQKASVPRWLCAPSATPTFAKVPRATRSAGTRRSSAAMPARSSASPRRNLAVEAAEQAAAEERLRGECRIARLSGAAGRQVQVPTGGLGVGIAPQLRQARRQPATRPGIKRAVSSTRQRQGGLVALRRRRPGIGPLCPFPGLDQRGDAAGVAAAEEVVGHRLGIRRGQRRQGLGNQAVPGAAAQWRDARVDCLARQGVRETHARAILARIKQPRRHRAVHDRLAASLR